jgi:hypothetical protein
MKKRVIYLVITSLLCVLSPHETKANWFTDLWEGVTSLFKPVWGKYTEGGSTVANIEKGRQSPPVHTLWHMAHALHVPIGDLFPGGKTEEKPQRETFLPQDVARDLLPFIINKL